MKLTQSAANAILNIMKNTGLDPKTVYFGIGVGEQGDAGIGFTRDRFGRIVQYGDLTVMVHRNFDNIGAVVDLAEINGKQGLIFLGEEQCRSRS